MIVGVPVPIGIGAPVGSAWCTTGPGHELVDQQSIAWNRNGLGEGVLEVVLAFGHVGSDRFEFLDSTVCGKTLLHREERHFDRRVVPNRPLASRCCEVPRMDVHLAGIHRNNSSARKLRPRENHDLAEQRIVRPRLLESIGGRIPLHCPVTVCNPGHDVGNRERIQTLGECRRAVNDGEQMPEERTNIERVTRGRKQHLARSDRGDRRSRPFDGEPYGLVASHHGTARHGIYVHHTDA